MNGWTPSPWAEAAALLVLVVAMGGRAEERSAAAPDLELLEFLGTLEGDDGEWIDPLQLLDLPELDSEEARDDSQADGTKRPDHELR